MAVENAVDYPISVRLPSYVVEKIDELVKKRKFRSRSDFIKFAVTFALGQIMMEEARERAKNEPEELEKERKEAWMRLRAGDFSKEDEETLELLKKVDARYKRLGGRS
ncbi:ribbon-helix-helix domain-containing protein [Pyrococcus horikoshii]|nr:type II toxin-antitoxin system ParD family antitoxin [Pyrococcus horikoshii]HII60948.1 type II toxin-antitoxin system ParD family antitoxin [Pyrococcus horikoshii]